MLHLVHRVYYKCKTTTHKTTFTTQESSLDPVPSSILARNAQEINITNCDVTTRSWVKVVNPWVSFHCSKWLFGEEQGGFIVGNVVHADKFMIY